MDLNKLPHRKQYRLVETTDGFEYSASDITEDHDQIKKRLAEDTVYYVKVGRTFRIQERVVTDWF